MLRKLENFYLFIFKEKELIGKVWDEKSRNLFLMTWKKVFIEMDTLKAFRAHN